MEEGLALSRSTTEVTGEAVFVKLGDVAFDGHPSADLAIVFFGEAAAEVVTAIPLEPSPRI